LPNADHSLRIQNSRPATGFRREIIFCVAKEIYLRSTTKPTRRQKQVEKAFAINVYRHKPAIIQPKRRGQPVKIR
jgi:hypothetical protein